MTDDQAAESWHNSRFRIKQASEPARGRDGSSLGCDRLQEIWQTKSRLGNVSKLLACLVLRRQLDCGVDDDYPLSVVELSRVSYPVRCAARALPSAMVYPGIFYASCSGIASSRRRHRRHGQVGCTQLPQHGHMRPNLPADRGIVTPELGEEPPASHTFAVAVFPSRVGRGNGHAKQAREIYIASA